MPLTDEPPDMPEQEDLYSLAELIDLALRNNPATRITWAQARSSAAQYGQSQSTLLPQLTGTFNYERVRVPIFSTNLSPSSPSGSPAAGAIVSTSGALNQQTAQATYYSDWGPQLGISYLVFDFGTLRATTEASRQALYNADWNHNSAIQGLLQAIMTDFYSYIYQKQLLSANKQNVETAQLTFDAAELGLKMGVRDVSDFLQAKTQLLQNQTTYSSQHQNVEVALAKLLTDMGLPANMKLATQDLPSGIPEQEVVPPLDQLIGIALQNRPDLLASEATVKSTKQTLRAAKTQFLPKLTYTFEIGRIYFNGGLHDKYDFDSAFAVNMPIFAGFYYRNAIKTAKANKKVAEEQLKISQLSVIQQVTVSHSNVKISYDTLLLSFDFLKAAQEQFSVSLSKYKQGTNTILDVTSAQNSLADARAQYVNSLQEWYTSLANLAYSTGLISPTRLPTESAEEIIQIPEDTIHE